MRQIAFLLTLSVCASTFAQPVPTDPDLRLWLKAEDLVSVEGLSPGDFLSQWVDASSYATRFAPRTSSNPNGPIAGFPLEEAPTLQLADINGDGSGVPTVQFDRSGAIFGMDPNCPTPTMCEGDPNIPGSGSTDRLYQTNNLTPNFDPLDMPDGVDQTAFIVFDPLVTSSGALGFQAVMAKRGTNTSTFELGIRPTGHFNYVVYDSITEYRSATIPAAGVWHVTGITVEDDPNNPGTPNDLIEFYDDESGDPNLRMNPTGVTPQNTMINRNPSTPEPFGIGGHSQNCCGEGETFAGNIAEIIIYGKKLTPTEFDDIETYLNDKYFALPTVGCDFDGNGACFTDDIDMLMTEIAAGTNDPTFDLTGDGLVNLDDRDQWLADAGAMNLDTGNPYLLSDANLDGTSDGQDFLAWNTSKFTGNVLWTGGNFNDDSTTDGQDFLIWNNNKFQTSGTPLLLVPEPASAFIMLLSVLGLGVMRHRLA